MNHMIQALKKKMMEKSLEKEGDLEVPMHGEDKSRENEEFDGDAVAGNAPVLEHDIEVESVDGPKEEAMEMADAENADEHLQKALSSIEHMKEMHEPADEEGDLQMSALQAISDHASNGRRPMSLHERAGAGAKDKLEQLKIMKMKKGK